MKTVLLIGSGGQVGQELQTTLSSIGHVIPIPRESLDLAQLGQVRETIQKRAPISSSMQRHTRRSIAPNPNQN